MPFRLYIDEVGNPDLKASQDLRHQYLSLTGVIMDLDYVADCAAPALESLKRRFFGSHPDAPVCLHRKDMVNYRHHFGCLRDEVVRSAFNEALMQLLWDLDYLVITVVIDKADHLARYGRWSFHPYHFCLKALLERYVMFLEYGQARGDVIAEARGGKEDRDLKDAFASLYVSGTEYIRPAQMAARLTSKELKIKDKKANIPGLQLADMIAHPSWRATICARTGETFPDTFGRRIAELLEERKYRRSRNGVINGYGRVWL